MQHQIITCDADVQQGAEALAAQHPQLAKAFAAVGPLPLRLRKDGFAALLSAIVSQQISVASADAVWRKLQNAGLTNVKNVKLCSDEDLRICGMSRQKILYAKALANSGVKYKDLRNLPDAEVIKTLIQIKGIGLWTAEIYTMFSLGRADVFASGDLALQEAAKELFELDKRPTEKEMRGMAAQWSPWQSVAARILWAYYRVIKQREGLR